MRRLTVLMPFHTPFYAPLPAGVALGHFRDEGLEITCIPAAAFGKGTMPALLDGDVEVSLGGLMRSLDLADRGGPIAGALRGGVQPQRLLSPPPGPRPAFAWSHLVGRTVLSFAEAPTPWQCMLTVLRQARRRSGPGPDRAHAARARRRRRLPRRARRLPRAGPAVDGELLAEGAAHLAASMGEATGPVPFTSYMTTPRIPRARAGRGAPFTRAVYRTQRWLARAAPSAIAATIAPAFPATGPALLERAVARYHGQGTWAQDPLLRRAGYDYLEEILLTGGLITRRQRYEDLVDTAAARAIMAETAGGRG